MFRSQLRLIGRQSLRSGPLALQSRLVNKLPVLALSGRRDYSGGPPPLTREFVQQRIIDVLSNCDKVNPEKLTPAATFEELGLDSLDVVDALFYIEEEFTIEMPDHEADAIKTVGDAVDYILKQPDAY